MTISGSISLSVFCFSPFTTREPSTGTIYREYRTIATCLNKHRPPTYIHSTDVHVLCTIMENTLAHKHYTSTWSTCYSTVSVEYLDGNYSCVLSGEGEDLTVHTLTELKDITWSVRGGEEGEEHTVHVY